MIKAVILSNGTNEQDMIAVGNQNKKTQNKDKWYHLNHMPMQSLLGNYHRLPLLYMDKSFIWLEKTK